jgi:hypothetical protein
MRWSSMVFEEGGGWWIGLRGRVVGSSWTYGGYLIVLSGITIGGNGMTVL